MAGPIDVGGGARGGGQVGVVTGEDGAERGGGSPRGMTGRMGFSSIHRSG